MRNSPTKSEKTLLLKGSHYKIKLAKFVYTEKKSKSCTGQCAEP